MLIRCEENETQSQMANSLTHLANTLNVCIFGWFSILIRIDFYIVYQIEMLIKRV